MLEEDGFIEAGVIRPSFGIALEATTQGMPRNFETGSILVASIDSLDPNATELPVEAEKTIWCEHDETHPMRPTMIWCLSDTDNDGQMDRYLARRTSSDNALIIDSRATIRGDLAIPVPYRTASADELPTRRVGYELCTPPTFSELKFASVIEMNNGHIRTPNSNACVFGERDESILVVDALTLQIQQTGDEVRYSIESSALTEGPAFLEVTGTPIQMADGTATSVILRAISGLVRQVLRPSLVATGPMNTVEAERFSEGDAILSIPVRYATTGVLRQPLSTRNNTLPAGTEMYGLEMFGSPLTRPGTNGQNLTWCAPSTSEDNRGRFRVQTICIVSPPRERPRWIQISNSDSLLPRSFSYNGLTPSTDNVLVDQNAETDFGYELTLSVAVGDIGRNSTEIHYMLDTEHGLSQTLHTLDLTFDENDQTVFVVARTNMKVTLARDPQDRNALRIVSTELPNPVEIDAPVL